MLLETTQTKMENKIKNRIKLRYCVFINCIVITICKDSQINYLNYNSNNNLYVLSVK